MQRGETNRSVTSFRRPPTSQPGPCLRGAAWRISMGPCRCLTTVGYPNRRPYRRAGARAARLWPATRRQPAGTRRRRRPRSVLRYPTDVRQFYLAYDGQDFAAPGLLFGYPIPPLAEACRVGRSSTGSPTTARAPAEIRDAAARDAQALVSGRLFSGRRPVTRRHRSHRYGNGRRWFAVATKSRTGACWPSH